MLLKMILYYDCRMVLRAKIELLITVSTLVTLGLPSCFAQTDGLAELYQQARAAQSVGNLKLATQKYEQIVRLRPDMAEAHSNLGALYLHQKQRDQAQRCLRTAIKLKPQLAGPYFFLGVLAYDARRYDEAQKYLKQAEAREPAATGTTLYLGYTAYAQGNYVEALQIFQKVADADPINADVFYYLSRAYGQVAKRYFAELQARYPASLQMHLAKGHVYEAEGNWAEAAEAYSKAAAQKPADERLKLRIGWVTAKGAGQPPAPAQDSDEEIIDGSIRFLYAAPDAASIRATLQRCRTIVGQSSSSDSAEGVYNVAENYQIMSFLASLLVLEVAPDSFRAHQLKAEYHESIGKDEEAIQEYREALKRQPSLVDVHFAIGNIYWKRDRLDEALPELKLELEVQPNHPQALYETGDVLLSKGDFKEAERYFLRSLQFEPKMVAAHLALEKIYTQMARYDSSVSALNKAIRLSPADPTPHYRLAAVYRKLGKAAEAQQEMEIFTKLKSQAAPN